MQLQKNNQYPHQDNSLTFFYLLFFTLCLSVLSASRNRLFCSLLSSLSFVPGQISFCSIILRAVCHVIIYFISPLPLDTYAMLCCLRYPGLVHSSTYRPTLMAKRYQQPQQQQNLYFNIRYFVFPSQKRRPGSGTKVHHRPVECCSPHLLKGLFNNADSFPGSRS